MKEDRKWKKGVVTKRVHGNISSSYGNKPVIVTLVMFILFIIVGYIGFNFILYFINLIF